jgi:type IV pilus assembly protein PilC
MATFQYVAVRISDKSKVQGTINAESERQARELLREQELTPTSIKILKTEKAGEKKEKAKEKSAFSAMIEEKFSSIGLSEKVSFTQNLEMMVKAGIPITEALLYMESYMDNPKFKRLVNSIRLDILAGYSFSRALGKHPTIFSSVYVSIVQAGEASGELETVLHRLSEMLIAEAKLSKKVISALIYPVMVIMIAGLVLEVMFIFVLPTFSDMYAKMGIKLPLITTIMVGISDFQRNLWYVAIALLIGTIVGVKKFVKTQMGIRFIDITLIRLPVIAPLVKAVACSHFISTLNVSFAAGLPITDCIFMACQTVTHSIIRQAFDEVNLKIQAGQRIAAALAETELLPGMIIIMLSTGEESGALDTMLGHALEYLEEEVNNRVEVLMSMMEPIMLVTLGVIVGCMALSIYLPLFGMYDKVH